MARDPEFLNPFGRPLDNDPTEPLTECESSSIKIQHSKIECKSYADLDGG